MNTDTGGKTPPGRIAYLYAVLPFIVGCVICSLLVMKMIHAIMATTDAYPRVLVPGVHTITLPEPGAYTIFFEYKSVIGNKAYAAPEDAISGLVCELQDAKTGEPIRVRPSMTNMSYSFAGREGTSLFEFTIPAAGDYRLEAVFPGSGETPQKYVLSIGHGFMKDIFQSIGLGFAITGILIISIGVSTAAIVVIYLRRSRGLKKC